MFKSAMGYLGSVAAAAGNAASDVNNLSPGEDDALVGSIVDVGGFKVSIRRRIGEGGFAFVYEAEDVNDRSKRYALKRLLAMDSEKKGQIVREISLLKTLSGHPNIVKFVAAAEAKGVSQRGCDEYLVLMEFCPTNLTELMTKRCGKCYPPATVAAIFAQITSAVEALHRSEPPVLHRDLKLENLLVDSSGKVLKLCDFGSATIESFHPNENWSMSQRNNLEEEMAQHTTPMYRAPEMLDTWSNYAVNIGSDIWALGCLLYFLCYGRHPFEDSAKLAIINGNYKIPENDFTYMAFHDLIKQMLMVDPSLRPNIGDVQEHLASVSSNQGFNISSGEADFEVDKIMAPPQQPPTSLDLNSPASEVATASGSTATTPAADGSGQAGLMSSLRGGAGSLMGKIRDTSKSVLQTVQHSMASRDLDLHLITERIGAMSYPAEGLESAMRNHVDDIAAIIENRHPGRYAIINLSERQYSGAKFTTGLVHHAGWSTSRPTSLSTILKTLDTCLDFLKKDPRNVIVIHCLDGKANTAVLVSALLMAGGFVKTYKDGLKFFALKRCDPVLEAHHKVVLRYLESAFNSPSNYIEARSITISSVVLEPVPLFSKNADGCRPFIEVAKCSEVTDSPTSGAGVIKVAPSSEFANLTFFSGFDGEAILKVNAKVENDVCLFVYHARQSLGSFLNTAKFDKLLVAKIYFHTGFLAGNSTCLRFKLRDMDGIQPGNREKYATDFKIVVNFRPGEEVSSTHLRCKNADLGLLFGTNDEMTSNRDMMGAGGGDGSSLAASPSVDDFVAQQSPVAPPRTKKAAENSALPKKPSIDTDSDDVLISPVVNVNSNGDGLKQKPTVPQPGTQPPSSNADILLDFGGLEINSSSSQPPVIEAATSKQPAASSNHDLLMDTSGTASTFGNDLLAPAMNNSSNMMMKTSSSAEFNVRTPHAKSEDPFDFLGLEPQQQKPMSATNTATMPEPSKPTSVADDLVSKMLGDLGGGGGGGGIQMKSRSSPQPTQNKQPPMGSSSSRPNYNVSFTATLKTSNGLGNTGSGSGGQVPPKVSQSTFEDLLGPSFTPSGGSSQSNQGKSIGEMKNAEVMKAMTPEEAKVFAWKDGKSRNLRALLCSLNTVIWPGSRWTQCGMHQLVSVNDVSKMYKKACLAVHPDKQMGTENEELSKLIFVELNDAWAEFNKDN